MTLPAAIGSFRDPRATHVRLTAPCRRNSHVRTCRIDGGLGCTSTYAPTVIDLCWRVNKLPPPPGVVWESLVEPDRGGARSWLELHSDEVEPRILEAERPHRVVWSSIWPSRPNDQVHFELSPTGNETLLKFTLRTPSERIDEAEMLRLRHRLSELLFAELRYSYGQ